MPVTRAGAAVAILGVLVSNWGMSYSSPTPAAVPRTSIQSDAGALAGCGADDLGKDENGNPIGFVPPQYRDGEFVPGGILTGRGIFRLLCGNGTSTGAVHIQLKHGVTNWAETLTCIRTTIDRGTPIGQVNRDRYEWRFGPETAVVAIDPRDSVVQTSFIASGNGDAWSGCAAWN